MKGLLSQIQTSICQFHVSFSFRVGFCCLFFIFFCLFFRVYPPVELPCVFTLTILLGVTEGLLSQIHAFRKFNYNGARFYYPSIHIHLGSVNFGSVGSVCFCVCINLGRVSVYHPLLHQQNTTLTQSTIFTI